VRDATAVEAAEVHAVMREDRSAIHVCEEEHIFICDSSTSLPRLHDREHVMSQSPESLASRVREILVGAEPRQRSRILILKDLALELGGVTCDVGPGVHEIGGPERRKSV
jgi:hypothetical protein